VLLGLDLVDEVRVDTHPADPLPYLLMDSRQVRTTSMVDALWLRIMDVPAALQARTYVADLDVVLEIGDGFRSDGGRFALSVRDGSARCVPSDAEADLVMDSDVLGSLYLGVHSALDLAAAQRIRYRDRNALIQVDLAFRSAVPAELGFHF
jgi:predicted acetyltransferase